ncbi:MAG: DUF2911 domain-containing protein [Ferruginibacter sp.]|nr:DUF2911 domain-containing protein [Ferruginibacter sp.]
MLFFQSRRNLIVIALLGSVLGSMGQGLTLPRTPSPGATVSQRIGISDVTVTYSRPAVKNREVWGALVPYGWNVQGFGSGTSAPWRAGANENTLISFSHNALLAGKKVPAGTYGLFYVVNKDNSAELILSRDTKSWGSFFYAEKNDVLRANLQAETGAFTELLTYEFSGLTKNSADLVLRWEKKAFPVKVEFDVDEIVVANMTEELKGPAGFNWQGFATAANYAVQNKTHYNDALTWIDRAIAQNKSFGTLSIKAALLRETGKAAEGAALMKDAVAGATENELNAYGYQLLAAGDLAGAVEMLQINTKRFPNSANAWDSLGEAYFTKGDKKNALTTFKKSLEMNPPTNVKANTEKYLKQLGEL